MLLVAGSGYWSEGESVMHPWSLANTPICSLIKVWPFPTAWEACVMVRVFLYNVKIKAGCSEWFMLVTPVLGKPKQEDKDFKNM